MKRHHIKASTKCIDLVSSLIELWENVPYYPTLTKVKGHADALHRSLTPLEKLNCIVDDYAKEIATYYFSHRTPSSFDRSVGISPTYISQSLDSSDIVKILQ